jgi:hypothetical protein
MLWNANRKLQLCYKHGRLFPDEAEQYIAAFAQDDKKIALIGKLSTLLQSLVVDSSTGKLHPEFQQYAAQLQQLAAGVQEALKPQFGDEPQPSQNTINLPQVEPVKQIEQVATA